MFFLKKCCKYSTPKQVKKTATNGGFETKRWETHAFLIVWKIVGQRWEF